MQRSDFTSTAFLRETCLPVMSPKLFDQLAVSDLADLQRHTLLHAESLSALWPSWLDAAGVPDLRPSRELRFEHLYYALQAAVDGVGIAMGPSALVADDVRMERLMALIPNPMLTLGEFHVLTPRRDKGHEGAHGPHVNVVLPWRLKVRPVQQRVCEIAALEARTVHQLVAGRSRLSIISKNGVSVGTGLDGGFSTALAAELAEVLRRHCRNRRHRGRARSTRRQTKRPARPMLGFLVN